MAFPDNEAKDVFVQVMAQLRADDFALLRAFDGRATISAYLRLVLRDVLSERVARLLSENPERGWRAFEHFFKRDLVRIIARYFPGGRRRRGRHLSRRGVGADRGRLPPHPGL